MIRRLFLRSCALASLALAAFVLKGPAQPLQPSAPEDGFGPLTRRRYWTEIEGASLSPEEIAAHWLQHLPNHAPKWLAWFRGLDHAVPPVRLGERLWILMLLVRRGRVVVEHIDSLGFRVRTLRLHPDAGTTDFRVYPGERPGHLILQVESLLRTRSVFDRLAYLLGVHAAQRYTWELTLASVARYAGAKTLNWGHESLEVVDQTRAYQLPAAGVGLGPKQTDQR